MEPQRQAGLGRAGGTKTYHRYGSAYMSRIGKQGGRRVQELVAAGYADEAANPLRAPACETCVGGKGFYARPCPECGAHRARGAAP